MLTGILLVTLTSYAVAGKITKVLDANNHPLATKVMLLWFAPLALFWGGFRHKLLGAFLIGLSYLILLLTELRSAALLPLIMGGLVAFWGKVAPEIFSDNSSGSVRNTIFFRAPFAPGEKGHGI